MRRQVRLLPAAERDLSRLVAFLFEKSPSAATRASTVLSEAIRTLADFSERGRKGPAPGTRELVVRFGRDAYIIQYRVETALVIVARVFDSRQDRRVTTT